MDNYALKVSNLTKKFKTGWWGTNYITVVDDISFNIKKGEIVGLLGTNGAGKTTTIQMLLGVMTPTSGNISYFGQDFAQNRSKLLEDISFASTYVRMPGKLTVYENLDFHAQLYGMTTCARKAQIDHYLDLFGISEFKDRLAGRLSAGQTTRLMLAKAFITSPKIVLLDEPTAALDPDISYVIREFVIEQRKLHDTAILFTSHNMDEVASVCDRVLVLKGGKIIANNTPNELARSVSNVYVQLFVGPLLPKAEEYAKEHGLKYKIIERSIEFNVQEDQVADLIMGLSSAKITYANISINKPTLEDYFLHISREK